MSTGEFNQLLLLNSDFLKPFAITLTRDNDRAKDLMQETMFRAIANREKYIFGTSIKAWLYTIMRNIFINDYRRRVKRNVILDSTPNDYLINKTSPTVTNEGVSILQQKEIQKQINHIPSLFKQPFLLYFEGYKYHEIAEMLEEPLGTIKSRIHFARKLLKERIVRF